MEKEGTWFFCVLTQFSFFFFCVLMLFRDDAEDFAHSEQNNLDIWNKSGMIEVIDSRTK